MMEPVSIRERKNIIEAKKRGESNANIIKWYGVCKATIYNIWNRFKETGSYDAKPFPGKQTGFTEEMNKKIIDAVHENPDITQDKLIEKFGLSVTQSGLSRHMIKLELSLKKRLSLRLDK